MQPRPQARIKPLSTYLANQIAAGEVVERPASVIKELVENSIDAGCQKIQINVEKGGVQRIRITDDGAGIHQDDLALAVSRHATSKIAEVRDLAQIHSMGFRGEALASIASVSRFSLQSRTAESDCAWQITVDEQAQCSAPVPSAHPVGTSIEVQHLFYNTPARRQFLRSERTEAAHCQDIVKKLALANFAVAFSLEIDGKMIYRLPAANTDAQKQQRVKQLCGKAFLEQAIEVDLQAPGLRLFGWLGLPEMTRSSADGQYFFLNGRVIRDKLINHALRQAYAEVIYPGRFPLYVLYLQCDVKDVDVNVHPTKHEVRFYNARLIHDFITQKLTPIILNQPQPAELSQPTQVAQSHIPPAFRTNESWNLVAKQDRDSQAQTHIQTHPPTTVSPQHVIDNRYAILTLAQQLLILDCVQLTQAVINQHCQNISSLKPQPLLIPERFSLSPDAVTALVAKQAQLEQLAIQFQRVGEESIIVKQWPKQLPVVGIEVCMQQLAAATSDEQQGQALLSIANHINYAGYRSDAWATLWSQLQWQPGEDPQRYAGMICVLDKTALASLVAEGMSVFNSACVSD